MGLMDFCWFLTNRFKKIEKCRVIAEIKLIPIHFFPQLEKYKRFEANEA